MNVRCQIAVVVLDEDGNEVATMWPFNADATQWVTSCKVALTQEECSALVEMGIDELEKLKARWMVNDASPSQVAPCSEPAPDASDPRE